MVAARLSIVVAVTACLAACGEARVDDTAVEASEALEFLDLRVEDVSATRAVVRFRTSRPTSCEALFGTDPDNLDRRATDPDMAEGELSLDHEVPLEDLLGETTYSWRAVAVDAAGRTDISATQSFTTPPSLDTSGWVNVAPTTQGTTLMGKSSNWAGAADDGAFGAMNAIDAQMATEWSSDGDGDDAWLELDLGQARPLLGFGYRSRMMTDGSSIVTSAELLLDGETRLGPFATPEHTRAYRFEFSAPITAQRVRFEARSSTGGNTGARDIQLFVAP
jgi:hypothetical protein